MRLLRNLRFSPRGPLSGGLLTWSLKTILGAWHLEPGSPDNICQPLPTHPSAVTVSGADTGGEGGKWKLAQDRLPIKHCIFLAIASFKDCSSQSKVEDLCPPEQHRDTSCKLNLEAV